VACSAQPVCSIADYSSVLMTLTHRSASISSKPAQKTTNFVSSQTAAAQIFLLCATQTRMRAKNFHLVSFKPTLTKLANPVQKVKSRLL
jgi:hypothetical protein